LKFYRLRSEAYFRPSEIFVNDRSQRAVWGPYPIEKSNVGCPEKCAEYFPLVPRVAEIVEKLRIRVDIEAAGVGGRPEICRSSAIVT
jgi:hypothetical protein